MPSSVVYCGGSFQLWAGYMYSAARQRSGLTQIDRAFKVCALPWS